MVVLFIVMMIFSAFFSGSESAYFFLKPPDIRHLKERRAKSHRARMALQLLEKPKRLLLSILIGNTLVNVAAATIAALFTSRLIRESVLSAGTGAVIEVVVVTLVLLIFSEVSPKVFAVKGALRFAERMAFPLRLAVTLLFPITILFEWLTRAVTFLFGVKQEVPFVNPEELKTLFEVGEEKGALDKYEKEMINSIFEFRDTTVREVMIPRMDMVCADVKNTIPEVLALIKDKGFSRIPVYQDTVDNIVGILFVKDLLPYMRGRKTAPPLTDLLRKAYFVPESKLLDELLKEFKKEHNHMAIVVDEYGGTAGLVSLEDVLEEIVGEIRDEFDREKPLVRKLDGGSWLIDAKIDIEDLNHEIGLSFPAEEDFESLGGFIFSLVGHIPSEKEEVTYQDVRMTVEKVQGRRIKQVRLQRIPGQTAAEKTEKTGKTGKK